MKTTIGTKTRRFRPGRYRPRGAALLCGALLAAFVPLSGCGTPPPGRFRSAPLVGVVTDTEGHPVSGAEITLDGRHMARSGLDGRFAFSRVRWGRHELLARSTGFEEARVELLFSDRRQVAYVRLTSKDHLLARVVDHIAAGELTEGAELLERVSRIDGPDRDADRALLEGVIRYRRGEHRAALEVIEPLLSEARTRHAAERLSATIRGDRSETQ